MLRRRSENHTKFPAWNSHREHAARPSHLRCVTCVYESIKNTFDWQLKTSFRRTALASEAPPWCFLLGLFIYILRLHVCTMDAMII